MERKEIVDEIKETLGKVPGFMNSLPDDTLENEWGLFKRFELQESSIPPKYRELMGLATASALHCWYCAGFHKAMAQLHGATDEEIQEASHYAKFSSGWSTYLNGIMYDKDAYVKELHDIGEYVAAKHSN